MIGTQAPQLVSASVLAWIALAGIAEPWMLYSVAFANGMVLVLDVPSRQQLTYRMVGRESLPNAIALNSSLFNASRIFGPAVAGIVYGFAGAGVCFLFNAISFFAVLLSLFWMRVGDFFPLEAFERPSILRGTREGLGYVRRQKRMVVLLSLTVVLSTFCFNFNVTLPVLAYETLHTNAQVYGLLSALFGARRARRLARGGVARAGFGEGNADREPRLHRLGAAARTAALADRAPAMLLFLVGVGFTAWSANSNAMVQLQAPDPLRGRIIGLYFYAFNGTGALAGLFAGWLCDRGGTELAFFVAGVVGLLGTLGAGLVFRKHPPRLDVQPQAASLQAA